MQVIADSSAGGRLGAALGTGLQELARNKLEHVQSQHAKAQSAQAYKPYFGQGISNLLANVSPEERKVLLQNPEALMKLSQLFEQQQGQQGQQGPMQQEEQQQQGGMGALQQQAPNLNAADFLGQNTNPLMRQALSQAQVSPEALMSMLQQQQQGGQQQQASPQQQPQQVPQQQSNFDQEKARLLGEAFTSPHERREKEKLELKKSDIGRKNNKEVREYLKPGDEKVLAARKNIRDYDLLEKLAKTGQLRSGGAYQLLSKVGLEDFNVNNATQVAKKLSQRLAQNASTAFGPGARITNYLEKTFQGSLPSLWNTAEGIIRISQINKLVDQGIELEQNIRRDLIKENKGEIPGDIEAQVRERFNPIDEQLAQQAEKIALAGANRTVDKIPAGYKGRVRDTKTGKIINVGG